MSFSAVSKMALRGFSGFEAMFRRSMAKKVNVAPHICEKYKQNLKKTKKRLKLYNMTKKETRPGVNCAEVCNPQATTVEVGTG